MKTVLDDLIGKTIVSVNVKEVKVGEYVVYDIYSIETSDGKVFRFYATGGHEDNEYGRIEEPPDNW